MIDLNLIFNKSDKIIFVKDKNSRFVYGNSSFLQLAGLDSIEEALGCNDYQIPWKKGQADYFIKQDNEVLVKTRLNRYFQKAGKFIVAGTKHLWRNPETNETLIVGVFERVDLIGENKIFNIISEVYNNNVIDYFKSEEKKYYFIKDINNRLMLLSKREALCLLYMIAGYSCSDTAKSIHLSRRTVESHINNIRYKLGVTYKKDIIRAAIKGDFLNNFLDFMS